MCVEVQLSGAQGRTAGARWQSDASAPNKRGTSPCARRAPCCAQGLNPDQPVEFEVKLVDFVPVPNWTTLSADDKLARAEHCKVQGNQLFQQARGWWSPAAGQRIRHHVLASESLR